MSDKDLFDTLKWGKETASEKQFLKKLSTWIINNTGNVNVAQRLAILSDKVGG